MILYGASGHGKVIADILRCHGVPQEHIVFWDDNPQARIKGYVVQAPGEVPQDKQVIISVGVNQIRSKIAHSLKAQFAKAIHPSAIIASDVVIGEGTVVMAGAVINSGTRIGKHVIINTGAIIDHDCEIGDFVHVSPNAALAGHVTMDAYSWLGIGASVIQGMTIGEGAIIGAGAAVISDIPAQATAVGVPARELC